MNYAGNKINGRGTTAAKWLLGLLIFMCFCIVTLGGYVRLSGSGLAIPEWPFFTKSIELNAEGEIISKTKSIWPPRSDSAWEIQRDIFVREVPGWQTGVSMDEFKRMFWTEWSHRGVAKSIGLVYLAFMGVALLFPANRAAIGWKLPVAGFFLLIFQAVLGGLAVLKHLPAINVAIHLTVGFFFTCLLTWCLLLMIHPPTPKSEMPRGKNSFKWLAIIVFGIITLQIFSGGLMAGSIAGAQFNTWPKMGDSFIPPNTWLREESMYFNMFEHIPMIQFTHRWFAIFAAAMVLFLVLRAMTIRVTPAARWSIRLLFFIVVLQVVLGIYTLLTGLNTHLALTHQFVGLVLMLMLLLVVYETTLHPVYGEEYLAEEAEKAAKAGQPAHA